MAAKGRSTGSRTHRRTLARQINLKEISEESEAKARKKREEEEKERERGAAAASASAAAAQFTHQVKPVTHHGQWKAQHSVLLPDGADSSSDDSEDDQQVEERETRRREADREKEKEMRLHGLLPSLKQPSKRATGATATATQLPAVAPSRPQPLADGPPVFSSSSAAAADGAGGASGAGDYSGFHKKALKWQKRSVKVKPAVKEAKPGMREEDAAKPQAKGEGEGANAGKGKEPEQTKAAADASKVKKGRRVEAQPMRRVGAWKAPALAAEGRVDMAITGLGRAREEAQQPPSSKAEEAAPTEQPQPSTAPTLRTHEGQLQLPPSALNLLAAGAADVSEEERRWRESTTEKLSARRALLRTESSSSLETAPPTVGPLSEKALALLSTSSSLTSSLSRALASSGASLIAQADMEMRRAREKGREQGEAEAQQPQPTASSPTSPRATLPPLSPPLSLPRLPVAGSSSSSSRPSSRKLRRVEAVFQLDDDWVEELSVQSAAVMPVDASVSATAARLSEKSHTVGQELRVESWGEEGEELVEEETVLSLRTIDMPMVYHTPSTATVLQNYLHDLSHSSHDSPSSLPPPPLSVHRLVHLPPTDDAAASASSASASSGAAPPYEPSAEAVLSYADCLGMDLPFDSDLLWIPRLALLQPLPPPWRCCESDGCIYFVHWGSGECSFTDPSDEFYASLYRSEKESKWSDTIERIMDASSVRRDGRLDFSNQRLDDVGMEVLSDMILGMADMEDERDQRRKEVRRRRSRETRRRAATKGGDTEQSKDGHGGNAPSSVVELEATADDDGGVGEEEEAPIPGYNAGLLLTSLDLSHNRVASSGCDSLLSSLSLSLHAPLSVLRLSSNALTSECCLLLSRYLQRNPYLLELDLSNNESIGNMGAEHLARSLTSATSLRWMSLSKTGLNDFGCHYLCAGLTGHPALSTLDLQHNDIGCRGWKDIARLAMTAHSLWDVRANGLRETPSTAPLRAYISDSTHAADCQAGSTAGDAAAATPSFSSSSALSADALLVRSEVLLCLDANRDSALTRARAQRALLAGLRGGSGDWCPLRRVFAVEAWAEKEEQEEDSPKARAPEDAHAGVRKQRRKDSAGPSNARMVEGGRSSATAKDSESVSSGAARRKGKGRAGRASGSKRKGSGVVSAAAGHSRSGRGRRELASAAPAMPAGVLVGEGGVRVHIGSVGIARQQGLADNALRQVWAFL